MNTKNKIVAILMAGIVAMAIGVPAMISAKDVDIGAEVGNVDPTIECTECPDTVDLNLKPRTGAVPTTVYINGTVGDDNGWNDINTVESDACTVFGVNASNCTCTKTQTGSSKNGTFSCKFDLDGCTPAGGYLVTVTVTDLAAATDTCNCTVTINPGIGLELDLSAVNFPSIGPGETQNITGNKTWDTTKLTVHNIGNDPIDLMVNATNMTNVSGMIPKSNIGCQIDASGWKQLAGDETFGVNIACCNLENVDLSLHVPDGTSKGTYTGKVKFTALSA